MHFNKNKTPSKSVLQIKNDLPLLEDSLWSSIACCTLQKCLDTFQSVYPFIYVFGGFFVFFFGGKFKATSGKDLFLFTLYVSPL